MKSEVVQFSKGLASLFRYHGDEENYLSFIVGFGDGWLQRSKRAQPAVLKRESSTSSGHNPLTIHREW